MTIAWYRARSAEPRWLRPKRRVRNHHFGLFYQGVALAFKTPSLRILKGHAPLVLGQLGPVGFGVAYGHVRPTDDTDEHLTALTGSTHVIPGHGGSGSTALGSGFDGSARLNAARGYRSRGLSLATLCADWLCEGSGRAASSDGCSAAPTSGTKRSPRSSPRPPHSAR